jgi:hypothetical protein
MAAGHPIYKPTRSVEVSSPAYAHNLYSEMDQPSLVEQYIKVAYHDGSALKQYLKNLFPDKKIRVIVEKPSHFRYLSIVNTI